jgi:HAD superfamily hydrolase (TIGR01549 family)
MTTSSTAKIHGIIFDLDGTLVGSQLNFPLLRELVGCPSDVDILEHVSSLPQDQQKQAQAVIEQHELDDAHTASWLPGAKTLVETISNLGLPVAIVTRNSPKAAQIKLDNNQIPIDIMLTRADAPAKPDPTALLQIAATWQLEPKAIAYVGDYKYDLQAAHNAGMQAYLYAPLDQPDYAHLAHVIYQHHDEFTEQLHQMVTN